MVTEQQKVVLKQLLHGPKTATGIASALNLNNRLLEFSTQQHYTYDRIHAMLRRLEDNEYVRRLRTSNSSVWELTQAGRLAANHDSV